MELAWKSGTLLGMAVSLILIDGGSSAGTGMTQETGAGKTAIVKAQGAPPGTAVSSSPPAGAAHPTPVLSLFPRGYMDHALLSVSLQRLARDYPDRVRLESLTKTLKGRDVWMVTLSQSPGSSESHRQGSSKVASSRPAILIVANLEADHVIGSQVALAMIETIARDPSWKERLDRHTIHVVPRLNPDGAELLIHGPQADLRTNLRPIDRDRDGKSGEDGPDDLNGDGVAVRMRVEDAKATLVPDPDEPRLLRKADPAKGERPVYSEYAEGTDNDGDGLINEDVPGGVNLNRNWPHHWTEFDPETGPNPASEPETHALIEFAFSHPEIAVVWSFGLNDNIASPPKKPGSTLDAADLPVFTELSRLYAKSLNPEAPKKADEKAGPEATKAATLKDEAKAKTATEKKTKQSLPAAAPEPKVETPAAPPAKDAKESAPAAPGATTDGAFSEWSYHQFGVVALASRLWQGPELPRAKPEPASGNAAVRKPVAPASSIPADGEARWLYWNDKVMGGRAFVPFVPFNHPILGRVQIGGWRPGVRLNPPAEQIETIARAHIGFLGELEKQLARLAIGRVKVEPRGARIFSVTATISNEGFLPTATAQGVHNRKADPVRIRLDTGSARLLAGSAREQVNSLAGSGDRREFRWLVLAPVGAEGQAPAAITLEVSTPKAGRVTRKIPLAPSAVEQAREQPAPR